MEEIICKECGASFENKKILANHVRWKHKDNSVYLSNIKEIAIKSNITRHGELIKEKIKCSHVKCDNEFFIEYREKIGKKEHYYCSRSCANSRGSRSESEKENIRIGIFKYLEQNGYEKVKVVENTICSYCGKSLLRDRNYNAKERFCSSKCMGHYRRRKTLEENGDLYVPYKSMTKFRFGVSSYPDEFDFSLIEQYGWYSPSNKKNNINGVSRDHIFSVKEGFRQLINPILLAHPANCRLMKHSDNISKNDKSNLTLDELIERIKKWDIPYKTNTDMTYVQFGHIEELKDFILNNGLLV